MTDNNPLRGFLPLSEDEQFRLQQIQAAAGVLEQHIEKAGIDGADARCVSLAKTKLEESVMWARKGIAG